MLKLVIGNKKYSSWSIRAYLTLLHTGAPFEEQVIGLDLPDTDANIRRVSPAGRVPVLIDGALTVWDSLAICEYLAEKFPQAKLWPEDPQARAIARSVCAEMHSGFQALRGDLSMKIVDPMPARTLRPEVQADVDRVIALWTDCRARFGKGGPYLFGHYTIADSFYAPVGIGRFRSYSVPLEGVAKDYVDALEKNGAVQHWLRGARTEALRAARYEP